MTPVIPSEVVKAIIVNNVERVRKENPSVPPVEEFTEAFDQMVEVLTKDKNKHIHERVWVVILFSLIGMIKPTGEVKWQGL